MADILKVLIIGNTANESFIAMEFAKHPKVDQVYVAPGNNFTQKIATNLNLDTVEEIADFVHNNKIKILVIGSEVEFKSTKGNIDAILKMQEQIAKEELPKPP